MLEDQDTNAKREMDLEESHEGSPASLRTAPTDADARRPSTLLPALRTARRREERLNGQLKRTDKRALRSRVRGLCNLLLVDCHERWAKQKKSKAVDRIFEKLVSAFPAGDWVWDDVLLSIETRQRNRRSKYRKMAERGERMPDDCSKRSWNEFVREVATHRANPNWNCAQRNVAAARTHHNLLGSGGIDSFKREFMERYGMRSPYEYVRRVKEIGRERFWDEFNKCGLGDVHENEEEDANSPTESSEA